MFKQRIFLLVLLASITCLTSSCEYTAAKLTADKALKHWAYTDYFFQGLDKRAQQREGEQEPILDYSSWCTEIYNPRIEYANYCQKQSQGGIITSPLMPFDVWKQTEYSNSLERQKQFMEPAKK